MNQTFPASAVAALKVRATELAKAVADAKEKAAAQQRLAESHQAACGCG
jgi:hypothetical protein